MQSNYTNFQPFRFFPGGDGSYFANRTWAGRLYDFEQDFVSSQVYTIATGTTVTVTSVTAGSVTFTIQTGSSPTYIIDP